MEIDENYKYFVDEERTMPLAIAEVEELISTAMAKIKSVAASHLLDKPGASILIVVLKVNLGFRPYEGYELWPLDLWSFNRSCKQPTKLSLLHKALFNAPSCELKLRDVEKIFLVTGDNAALLESSADTSIGGEVADLSTVLRTQSDRLRDSAKQWKHRPSRPSSASNFSEDFGPEGD